MLYLDLEDLKQSKFESKFDGMRETDRLIARQTRTDTE